MNKHCLAILSLPLIFLGSVTYAQKKVTDSLLAVLRADPADTVKVSTLNSLAWITSSSDPLQAVKYARHALQISDQLVAKHDRTKQSCIANSLHTLAWANYVQGNYSVALDQNLRALAIRSRLGDSASIVRSVGNIGNIYLSQGNFPRALEYYFRALHADEQAGNKSRSGLWLGNLGVVYSNMGDHAKALYYYMRSLRIDKEIGDRVREASDLGNIGNIYVEQGDSAAAMGNLRYALDLKYPKALACYERYLEIATELGNRSSQALAIDNIGSVYKKQGDPAKAMEYYIKALRIDERLGDKAGIARHLGNMGTLCRAQGKLREAADHLEGSLKLSEEIGDLYGVMEMNQHLSVVYEEQGRWARSLEHFRNYVAARDSLSSEENTKKTVQLEMNYEFEKKEAAARLEQEKKDAILAADARRQRIILLAISGFGLLVLGFALFAYRSYLQKKKANIEISAQKQIIEEKQKEILDSIHYAKRIQTALMPSERYVRRVLATMRQP